MFCGCNLAFILMFAILELWLIQHYVSAVFFPYIIM